MSLATIENPTQLFNEDTPVDLSELPPADARVMLVAVDEFATAVQREYGLEPEIVDEATEVTREIIKGSVRRAIPGARPFDAILHSSKPDEAIRQASIEVENNVLNERNFQSIKNEMIDTFVNEEGHILAFAETDQAPSGLVRFMAECLVCELSDVQDEIRRKEVAMTLEWMATHPATREVIEPVVAPLELTAAI